MHHIFKPAFFILIEKSQSSKKKKYPISNSPINLNVSKGKRIPHAGAYSIFLGTLKFIPGRLSFRIIAGGKYRK
jgi:hypothetical protein